MAFLALQPQSAHDSGVGDTSRLSLALSQNLGLRVKYVCLFFCPTLNQN
jgi:hypothetical protein